MGDTSLGVGADAAAVGEVSINGVAAAVKLQQQQQQQQ